MNDRYHQHEDDPLQAALRFLPREREPSRDLWPEVAERIRERRRRQRRSRTAVGLSAFLAAAGFALLVGTLGGSAPLAGPDDGTGSGGAPESPGPSSQRLVRVSSGGMGGNGTGGSGGMAAGSGGR